MNAFATIFEQRDVPTELRQWAAGHQDSAIAWNTCERGDWLLAIAVHVGIDGRQIAEAMCDVAAMALAYVPNGKERPVLWRALEQVRAWARNEATPEALEQAFQAASEAIEPLAQSAIEANAAASAEGLDRVHSATAAFCGAKSAIAALSADIVHTNADGDGYAAAVASEAAEAARFAAGGNPEAALLSLGHSASLVRAKIPWSAVAAALASSLPPSDSSSATHPLERELAELDAMIRDRSEQLAKLQKEIATLRAVRARVGGSERVR